MPRAFLVRLGPLAAALLTLALCMLHAERARPFSVSLVSDTSGPVVRWPRTTLGFYLHPACSIDLPTATCLAEVRASFAAWSAPCSAAVFNDLGTSTNLQLTPVGGAANGRNEVGWIETSTWTLGKYVLGVAAPIFQMDGTILEADIALNGYLQTWSTSGADYATDVRNVVVHEIGHFFGLQHNLGGFDPADPPTMAPVADNFMRSRTPNADDLRGLCFLLPRDPYHCAMVADCPTIVADGASGEYYAGQLQCAETVCGGMSAVPAGDGALGTACASDVDCLSGLVCQPWNASGGICTHACKPSQSNCEAGYSCAAYGSNPNKGLCLPTATSGGTVANGQPCATSGDCVSNLCVTEELGPVCRAPCSALVPCAGAEACQTFVGSSEGACVPVATTKPDGEVCVDPAECRSGMCASIGGDFLCVSPCGSDGECPGGYACALFEVGFGGCFPGGAGLAGDPCASGWDCQYDLCFSFDGGATQCSEPCVTTADCPCGWECGPSSQGEVCFPGDRVACVLDGAACGFASECRGGYCLGGSCASGCQTTGEGCLVCAGWAGSGDADHDGVADRCDDCPGFADTADADHDGVPDGCDNCALAANVAQADADHDDVGDACDRCADADDRLDADHDGVPDACEGCTTALGPGCDDGDPCTTDACALGTCTHVAHSDGCDDGDGCTSGDRCTGGVCAGTANGCDDANGCTTDACVSGACRHAPIFSGTCSDGDPCTIGDYCLAGTCLTLGVLVCDPGEACMDDGHGGPICAALSAEAGAEEAAEEATVVEEAVDADAASDDDATTSAVDQDASPSEVTDGTADEDATSAADQDASPSEVTDGTAATDSATAEPDDAPAPDVAEPAEDAADRPTAAADAGETRDTGPVAAAEPGVAAPDGTPELDDADTGAASADAAAAQVAGTDGGCQGSRSGSVWALALTLLYTVRRRKS